MKNKATFGGSSVDHREALTMPMTPTVVCSLYGMNFAHMPALKWRWGYPAVISVIVIGCALLYRRLKRVGWL